MRRAIATEHLTFFHVTGKSMEHFMHTPGSIITENLTFCHFNRKSMEILKHVPGSIITKHVTFYISHFLTLLEDLWKFLYTRVDQL